MVYMEGLELQSTVFVKIHSSLISLLTYHIHRYLEDKLFLCISGIPPDLCYYPELKRHLRDKIILEMVLIYVKHQSKLNKSLKVHELKPTDKVILAAQSSEWYECM